MSRFPSSAKDMNIHYGQVERLSPLVRRVLARNPGPFTFTGTGTFIIGTGSVAVIDPGPLNDEHLHALSQALEGETLSHIIVTHTHADHSPAAAPLQQATNAPTYGYGPHGSEKYGEPGIDDRMEEGCDRAFKPDVPISDGDVIEGEGWILDCLHTPGHTSNHICYSLREEKTLFSGDHVMGWSTSVIIPPDGHMGAYLDSLQRLAIRDDELYRPTHGPKITKPQAVVRAMIGHRKLRETQIVACLEDGFSDIGAMVSRLYKKLDNRLRPAAALSVYAHLIHLIEKDVVVCEDTAKLDSTYALKSET